jgi:hypothetical protein
VSSTESRLRDDGHSRGIAHPILATSETFDRRIPAPPEASNWPITSTSGCPRSIRMRAPFLPYLMTSMWTLVTSGQVASNTVSRDAAPLP